MRRLKASELVFDFDFYPRASVDSQHVSYMVEALDSGAEFPPIVICKKSKRIVDGFHRTRAHQRHLGADALVPVAEKTYRTDQELFLDAMRYNAAHGRNLTTYDRAHCAIKAASLGIDDALIAETLHVNPDRIGELRSNRSATHKGLYVPIKRTIRHMAGKALKADQVEANRHLSGMNQQFYANQLITLIESGLLNTSDENLMEAIQKLHGLLETVLVKA